MIFQSIHKSGRHEQPDISVGFGYALEPRQLKSRTAAVPTEGGPFNPGIAFCISTSCFQSFQFQMHKNYEKDSTSEVCFILFF